MDPFLRLWFGVVSRYESLIEFGRGDEALRLMKPALASHTAWCFEAICRQYVEDRTSGFGVIRVGRCWDRHQEIDVVGVDSVGRISLAGECKMTRRPVGVSVLQELQGKFQHFSKGDSHAAQLMIFSTGGFTQALKSKAKDEGVLLVGAEELI